jgi:tetratricopeptide (TPR) repeat protein
LAPLVALMDAGCYAELAGAACALLSTRPQSGFVWQLLAVALGKQGKDALEALARAAQCLPDDAVAHLNMGNAFGRLGRLEDAAASFGRALAINPDFAEAHNNLADLQLELGRDDDAVASCRRALKVRPDFAEAHENLAKASARLGQLDEAVVNCRRALEIRPDFAEAHNTLGNVLSRLARLDDAMASFRRALLINPDFAEAHLNLANALRSIGRLDDAVAGYRRALLIKPDFAAAYTELGTALRLQRCTLESEASCRKALAIDPQSAATLAVLAELRADAGRFAEAEALYRGVISIDPDSSEAWAGLARLRRMTPADEAWLAEAQRLVGHGLPPHKELSLRYAIGKYFDDLEDFDKAFLNYQRANELAKLCGPAHDRSLLTRTIDLIIRSHNQTWVGLQRSAANPSTRPVVIVGMLRSGTTLAEQILASHPGVFGAGELTFWGAESAAAIAGASAANAPEIDMSDAVLAGLSNGYVELLQRLSADAPRVVDKFPTNFLFLGLIHAALPNARIIHMRRNPIDTCLSIYFQRFEAANTYVNDLEDLAHYYREYRRLMQHWRTVLPAGVMLEVPYEGLVADLEAWSRKMLDFIALPWHPRCLDFHRTARTVVTASKWQVRQKISASSVERWRHYEKFLGPLKPLLESRDARTHS